MPSMQTSDVTQEQLQRLARYEAPDGARVLSLYLNLDPHANLHVRENRRTAVHSLVDEAARAVEGIDDLDHGAHVALREDVSRTRTELEQNLDDGWAEGAHALALFVCGPDDLFEVLHLPRPVDSRVVIAERPAIEPLAEVGPAEQWAVLLLDGNDARLLEGLGDRLEESEHEHVERAGTAHAERSAFRMDRPVDTEEHRFVQQVAERLREADRRAGGYARIFVGANERLFGQLRELLSPEVGARVAGRFDAGADWERPQSIRERLEPLLQKQETHREHEALEKLPTRGARGIADVLEPLYERRVETLLIEPGVEHPGVVCPRCRWAAAEERGACPVDGEEMVPHPNLVEWAVELAVAGDAEVLPVRRHNDLSDHDGIAAVLRF